MTEAFPLQWPAGWPRHRGQKQYTARFKTGRHTWSGGSGVRIVTFAVARDKLYEELTRLGAKNAVISTNHPPDVRGMPIESKRKIADEGVAVYFSFRGKPMVMACDRYDTAAGNMRSLGLAIEGLRQLERHGGGTMMEKAFEGFAALSDAPHWTGVLGVSKDATVELIEAAYRQLAKKRHPDVPGGSAKAMMELNAARQQAISERNS